MIKVPSYVDGYFDLYKLLQDEKNDFPEEYIKDLKKRVWYNELSIFDRLRYELEQRGKVVTMKITIPQYREINSNCLCRINGVFHEVYNAAHITNKDGFRETELTLIAPERKMEGMRID